jgi:2-oxoglutarate dehydrogenase E2 component (dihydrolipoamide succinyltransferase)
MAQIDLIMPKMGESIMEATILKWLKQPGDKVEMDEAILEIATDKVDSEVPSPVSGTIVKILFNENDVVPIGKIIAVIATEGEEVTPSPAVAESSDKNGIAAAAAEVPVLAQPSVHTPVPVAAEAIKSDTNRFYSPLVKNIAKEEKVSQAELDALNGTGLEGRVTKQDILRYVEDRKQAPVAPAPVKAPAIPAAPAVISKPSTSASGNVEIIEMDRMRKLIAENMVASKQTSAHVTSFVEADVTNLVNWRNQIKKAWLHKYGDNITFTPVFIEAVTRAIGDFPMINSSVEGTNIVIRKDINIGMAAALPTGNLIVPVIRNANLLNLAGLTKAVNDFAVRARNNKLKPDEIQGGTFTLSNVGSFGSVMGTPIILQPQVAILATGTIRKKPAVLETEYGDVIAIRQMMFLSLTYDHRIVDGYLGGSFLKRVADYLEAFDPKREI